MISYRADGLVLMVSVRDLGKDNGALQLSVVIDRRDAVDASCIAATDGGWRANLPPELCNGRRHRIALDVLSDGQSLDRIAFSFAASTQTVNLRRPDLPGRH